MTNEIKKAVLLMTYAPTGWAKILQVAADRETLRTYEEMEHLNAKILNESKACGDLVQIVPIDADALISWCESEGRPLDMLARSEFAGMTFTEMNERAGRA